MTGFNNDILISNIKTLMSNNSVTQEIMAWAIGMSQPNFNHAINNTGGKRFTIEQIFDMAHYFGVSIDWLMGNQGGGAITAKSSADFISRAVSSGNAKLIQVSVEDVIYRSDKPYCDKERHKKEMKYWAMYFPSYFDPYETITDDEEYYNDIIGCAECGGNDTLYMPLNAFLDKLVGFHDMYVSRKIDAEDYQTLVAKNLEMLK